MIVRVGMAPRAEGKTYEAFQHHWRSGHADVAREIPGLRSYVQNHAVLEGGVPLLPYAGFDACSEIEFDSLEAMDAGFASETYRTTVSADETNLIDRSRFMLALMDRRVLRGGDPGEGVKLMTFWRAAPGADPARVSEALAAYAEATGGQGGLRHEQLHEIPGAHDGRQPAPYQAIDAQWFPDPEAAMAFLRGDAAQVALWGMAGIAQCVARLLAREVPVVQRAA